MSEIESVLQRLLKEPECSIVEREHRATLPDAMPQDVKDFFGLSHGGGLFYRHDYPTPQFGCELSFSHDRPVSQVLNALDQNLAEGPEFDHLWTVAFYTDAGEDDFVAVSVQAQTFGYIYSFSSSLGAPLLNWEDRLFLASSFTRWLEIHLEAWSVYEKDWRSGLQRYGDLIAEERRSHPQA